MFRCNTLLFSQKIPLPDFETHPMWFAAFGCPFTRHTMCPALVIDRLSGQTSAGKSKEVSLNNSCPRPPVVISTLFPSFPRENLGGLNMLNGFD